MTCFLQEKVFNNQAGAESATCFHAGFFLSLFFCPEDGSDVPPKRQLTLNGLHDVISQKMVLFRTTAVRTSNPTSLF
jgi:hypothetical protein